MRKNLNSFTICGYVYDCSKLAVRQTGEASKNPGTTYIAGDLDVAVDEQALNVVTVHFTYVTEVYAKSGKTNNTFTALQKIIDNSDKTWIAGGKDVATKVKVDGSLGLNDFYNNEGNQVSSKRCEGSFVTIISVFPEDPADRNKFQMDMVLNRVTHIDADPEKHIDKDYDILGGAVFNFRNELLPCDFVIRNEMGMKLFEDMGISNAEPVYTKIWGHINSQTIKTERVEESAFGEAAVTTYERKSREWVVTGTAKVPYDFGDEEVMTAEELTKAMQDREVHWADIKKRNDEYQASKNAKPAAAPAAKSGSFVF